MRSLSFSVSLSTVGSPYAFNPSLRQAGRVTRLVGDPTTGG
jgi:hypothetical protein